MVVERARCGGDGDRQRCPDVGESIVPAHAVSVRIVCLRMSTSTCIGGTSEHEMDNAKAETHPHDICECGDYRAQHDGPEGRGRCKLNALGHGIPRGYEGAVCAKFKLSRKYEA